MDFKAYEMTQSAPATVVCRACGAHEARPYAHYGRLARKGWKGRVYDLYDCHACGHKQFVPFLTNDDLYEIYGNMFNMSPDDAKSYMDNYENLGPVYRALVDRVLELVRDYGLPANARVHEFGCGAGMTVHHMRKAGLNATGSDWSASAVQFANEAGNHHVFQEDMTTSDRMRDQKIDLVLFNHSIEHVPDPIDTTRRMAVMLGPHSVMLMRTNHGDGIVNRLYGMNFDTWFYFPLHLHYFSPRSFEALARSAGCVPLEVHTTTRGGFWRQSDALRDTLGETNATPGIANWRYQGAELEVVIGAGNSIHPSRVGALPPPQRNEAPLYHWDSHADFFLASKPWRYLVASLDGREPTATMAFSETGNYRYYGISVISDAELFHSTPEHPPMLEFTAPKTGYFRFDIDYCQSYPIDPVELVITRPNHAAEIIKVTDTTPRRLGYDLYLAKEQSIRFAMLSSKPAITEKLNLLVGVRFVAETTI